MILLSELKKLCFEISRTTRQEKIVYIISAHLKSPFLFFRPEIYFKMSPSIKKNILFIFFYLTLKFQLLHIVKFVQLRPGICSMIKVEDVGDVLTEANVKAAEAILLFCQVQQKIFQINMLFSFSSVHCTVLYC